MLETSARLLRLLTLLQTRREWSAPELADRLGISTRTVRRDVDKLRDLDYPVDAVMGATGGYRLGRGAELPPLLLDDEEAVAVALGLQTAAGGGVEGIGETALQALVKLEQVLPSRLRHRVAALQIARVPVQGAGPTVDPTVLTAVAAATRDQQRLRFDYTDRDGTASLRTTEPHRIVTWGRRWYLLAWDVERDDWRTFRVDRLTPRAPTGPRFAPREPPDGDAAAFVARRVSDVWAWQAVVLLHASAPVVESRMWNVHGRLEAVDGDTCRLHIGADSAQMLAYLLAVLDVDFEVESPPELAPHLQVVADRYARAAQTLR